MAPVYPISPVHRLSLFTLVLAVSVWATAAASGDSILFDRVTGRLDSGGTEFMYRDLRGAFDPLVAALASSATAGEPQQAEVIEKLIGWLALESIQAMGSSTVRAGPRHRSRMFVALDGPPRGLVALAGAEARPFTVLQRLRPVAGAGGEFQLEGEMIRVVVSDILLPLAGRDGAEFRAAWLGEGAGRKPGIEAYLQDWLPVVTFALALDGDRKLPVAPGVSIPMLSFELEIKPADLLGTYLGRQLEMLPGTFTRQRGGGFRFRAPPTPLGSLTMEVADNTLSIRLLGLDGPLLAPETGSSGHPDLAEWTAALPTEGSGLIWVGPKVSVPVIQLFRQRFERDLAMQEAETFSINRSEGYRFGYQLSRELGKLFLGLSGDEDPQSGLAMAWGPEPGGYGMISETSQSHSLRSASPTIAMGLTAAMAIPAFQRVRRSAREKMIENDARQVAAAAHLYMLENGVSRVPFGIKQDGTVEPPLNIYIKQLTPGLSFRGSELGLDRPFEFEHAEFPGEVFQFDTTGRRIHR